MDLCYMPAIVLFILALFVAIQTCRVLWWGPALFLGSVPLFFGILCWVLCKKNFKKLVWIMPLTAFIVVMSVVALM